jgi:hypothetical protein
LTRPTDPQNPPPRPRRPHRRTRIKLETLGDVKRELAAVYREARAPGGTLDWQDCGRAANTLHILARLIEGSEIEQRLAEIERRLDDEDPCTQLGRRRPNGQGRHVQ